MSRKIPYLQRRGNSLEFRIAIPIALRSIVGVRELVKALHIQDHRTAAPVALLLAAQAKQLFIKLHDMTKRKTSPEELNGFDYTLEWSYNESGEVGGVKLDAEPHETEEAISAMQAMIESNAAARQKTHVVPAPTAIRTGAHKPTQKASGYTLKMVVDDFLKGYQKDKYPTMFKTHTRVLKMLLEVITDKPVSELKQADFDGFFKLVGSLPNDWPYQCREYKVTLKELADLEHDETIAYKTFKSGYVCSVRPFLKWARVKLQDQGFPLGLTTELTLSEFSGKIEADGKGKKKQRPFMPHELKRLFEGEEMKAFANDTSLAHYYWLLHLALFTGGRVNELCQLNPQVDIFQDADSGTWLLWINEKTEADHRIKKTVKTGDSREVPIHKTLIELGFLQYVERVKSSGAKLLFPKFKPASQRASRAAEWWFVRLIRNTDLRDETLGARIVGMHAFRHTFLSYGADQKPALDLTRITGHAQLPFKVTDAAKGYFNASMLDKIEGGAELLNQLNYDGLTFFKPQLI